MPSLARGWAQQRKIVYKAEQAVPIGKRFESMEQVREFAKAIVESSWWKERAPSIPQVAVLSTKSQSVATSGVRVAAIYLPQWGWTDFTVIHELAHTLTAARHGIWHDHDSYWVYWMGRMVEQFMGDEALQKYVESMFSHGINPWAQHLNCEGQNTRLRLVAPVEEGPVWLALSKDNVDGYLPLGAVLAALEKQGKSVSSLVRAMGGDKGVKPPAAEYWRPKYMGKTRWLPEECLKHINELGNKKV